MDRRMEDEAALADLALDYLSVAQPEFCSSRCPSVGREGVPIPHSPECESMRSLLVARVAALPSHELLREALEALDRVLLDVEFMWDDGTLPNRRDDVIYVRARATAEKIRAELEVG